MTDLTPFDLTTDLLDRPLGLESAIPRLAWKLSSARRGARQGAYRIVVADSREAVAARRGEVWDSGRVESDRATDIRYAGPGLTSARRYWWTVEVWDADGTAGATADPVWWETGLFDPADWRCEWLEAEDATSRADRAAGLTWIWAGRDEDATRARRFRGALSLPSAALSGSVAACGGDRRVRLSIDGIEVAATEAPPYAVGVLPLAESETGRLEAGEHVVELAIEAAPVSSLGEPDDPGVMAVLRFDLEDGSRHRAGSDLSWVSPGPHSEDEPVRLSATQLPNHPPAPEALLRHEFEARAGIRSARLRVAALGSFQARINGAQAGDAVFEGEITEYSRRVLARVTDVTDLVVPGRNVVGLRVGDGWYASFRYPSGRYQWEPPRRVIAQLELEYEDGGREIVGTGDGWRVADGPVRRSEIFDGAVVDARFDRPGWDRSGFDDADWADAVRGARPTARIATQVSAPLRATEVLRPVAVTSPAPGVTVVDFGQNVAGWCRLRVRGAAGTAVRLRHAESVTPDGNIDQRNLRLARQRDVFVLAGTGEEESFEPSYTYHGFRYVEVVGLPSPLVRGAIEAIVVGSDLAVTGTFRTDEPLVDRIHRAIVWTQRANLFGLPTDCPQRDERGAWLGDAGVFWESATFNMDVAAFGRRFLDTSRDGRNGGWAFPPSTPAPFLTGDVATPAWADGHLIVAWTIWRRSGDTAVIEENWDAMASYVDELERLNPDHVWRAGIRSNLSDWLAVDETRIGDPTTVHEVMATGFWANSVAILGDMAEATARLAEAARLAALRDRIRATFAEKFVSEDGVVGNGSQAGTAMALRFGLVPDALRDRVGDRLADAVRSRGPALSTGIIGTQFVLDALTETGHLDLAVDLLLRREFPSWGHMLDQGATTIWESWSRRVWSGLDEGRGSFPASESHYVLGAVDAFLYRRIAGIDAEDGGFDRILIAPAIDPRIPSAGADYESVAGRVSVDWRRREDGGLELDATIPANTTARVLLPAENGASLAESGVPVEGREDVDVLARTDAAVELGIGSGTYSFVVSPGPTS